VTSADSPRTNALTGRYTIERELGRAGMATVYLARDLKHDPPVALKVLHPAPRSSSS
jgi:serine/threonine protein kinase